MLLEDLSLSRLLSDGSDSPLPQALQNILEWLDFLSTNISEFKKLKGLLLNWNKYSKECQLKKNLR